MKKHPVDGADSRARILRRNMAEAETALWRMLRAHQANGHKFRRQVPLGKYIADFVCHQARLIVEVDGGQHERESDTEKSRTGFLQSQGYRVLRFWNNEVLGNPEGVYSAISSSLSETSPPPNPPPSKGEG